MALGLLVQWQEPRFYTILWEETPSTNFATHPLHPIQTPSTNFANQLWYNHLFCWLLEPFWVRSRKLENYRRKESPGSVLWKRSSRKSWLQAYKFVKKIPQRDFQEQLFWRILAKGCFYIETFKSKFNQ